METSDLAAQYSDKMHQCTTVDELDIVAKEVKQKAETLTIHLDWLRDEYISVMDRLNTPQKPIEDLLNKTGLKALEKGLI